MAAPTNAAFVKKVLANSEPSTHGPKHVDASVEALAAQHPDLYLYHVEPTCFLVVVIELQLSLNSPLFFSF